MRGGFWSPSERVDVAHGQLVARGLDAVTIVMRLHELAEVDRRAAGGRERGRLKRLAEMREEFSNWPGVGDECDEADVAAAGRALEWEVFRDPRDELGPRDLRGVVGAGLVVPCTRTPALCGRLR